MKRTLPLMLLLFWGADNAFSQTFNWARQLSVTNGEIWGNAVSTDSARNSYVTGGFTGKISFPNPINCPALTAPPGIGGGTLNEVFVAKFDSGGVCQWAKHYGAGGDDGGNGIVVDRGDVYVTGHFVGRITFDSYILNSRSGLDIFIAKLNPSGAVQWAVRGGGTGNDIAYSVASRGSPYVTGFVSPANGPVTFDSTSGSPCTLAGVGASRDIFVVRYTSAGVCQMAKREGTNQDDIGYGASVDGTGNVYVTGVSSGKAFISKRDSTLNQILWSKVIDGNSVSYGISTDSQGNSYIAGQFSGTVMNPFGLTSVGPSDGFVAMFETTQGTPVWVRTISGPGSDVARGISVRETCDLFVTGSFMGTANFGNTTSLTSNGGSDIFVAHYYVGGGIQWVVQAGGSRDEEGRGISADSFGKASVIGIYMSNSTVFTGTSPNLTNPNVTRNTFLAKASP